MVSQLIPGADPGEGPEERRRWAARSCSSASEPEVCARTFGWAFGGAADVSGRGRGAGQGVLAKGCWPRSAGQGKATGRVFWLLGFSFGLVFMSAFTSSFVVVVFLSLFPSLSFDLSLPLRRLFVCFFFVFAISITFCFQCFFHNKISTRNIQKKDFKVFKKFTSRTENRERGSQRRCRSSSLCQEHTLSQRAPRRPVVLVYYIQSIYFVKCKRYFKTVYRVERRVRTTG